jgi:hypothetical protein
MLESILQTITEFIYGGLTQIGIIDIDIDAIKLGVKISIIIIALWLAIHRNKRRKPKEEPKTYGTGKSFKPPRWTPDGYYYDQEKQRWIGPDFKPKDK